MLRPAVITRKVGGCNKTLLGAVVHGVLASLMVTCKRQGRRFLDLAKRLWQTEETQAIPSTPYLSTPDPHSSLQHHTFTEPRASDALSLTLRADKEACEAKITVNMYVRRSIVLETFSSSSPSPCVV